MTYVLWHFRNVILFGGYVLVLLVQRSLEHIRSGLGLHTWARGSALVCVCVCVNYKSGSPGPRKGPQSTQESSEVNNSKMP